MNIMDRIQRLLRWWADGTWYEVPTDGSVITREADKRSAGVPVTETDGGKLWAEILTETCPHCKAHPARFLEGPSGGMSTNIQCDHCGWWFNVTPVVGIAEDIGDKGGHEKKMPDWREDERRQ